MKWTTFPIITMIAWLFMIFATGGPILVLAVTLGEKHRTAYLARSAAFAVLALFWLCLGINIFLIDGVYPIFLPQNRSMAAMIWVVLFGCPVWASVHFANKAGSLLVKAGKEMIKMPYHQPLPPELPKQRTDGMNKQAEACLSKLLDASKSDAANQ